MSEIILYQTADNQTQVDVKFDGETVWLSQDQIAELFQRDRSVITKHLKNVFVTGELDEEVVCCKFCTYHSTWCG